MPKIGVALFGLGRAGSIHLENMLNGRRVDVLYIVDTEVESARQRVTAECLTETQVVHPDDAAQLFDDGRVQAIVVATPTFTHDTYISLGLKNKRAVFVEKPVAGDDETTKKLYDLAQDQGVPLFCSFNRRLDPAMMEMYSRLRNGEVGKLYTVRTTSRDNPLPPLDYLRTSGGFFHDMAVHDLDYICWLAGEFPCALSAQATANHPEVKQMNDIDTAVVCLRFPSGLLATCDFSRIAPYGYDQRVEVLGPKGALLINNSHTSAVSSSTSKGILGSTYSYSFPQRYRDSYIISLSTFFDIVEGKDVQYISGAEVIMCSRLATLCEESYHSGKTLAVPEDWFKGLHPHVYTLPV